MLIDAYLDQLAKAVEIYRQTYLSTSKHVRCLHGSRHKELAKESPG